MLSIAKKIRRLAPMVVLGAAGLGTALCAGAMVLTPSVHITKIDIYTDAAADDVVFRVDTATPGCQGFWLSPSDNGFKQAYAALLMAKASQTPVVVYAYDNQLWPASSDSYCRVRSLSPQ